MSIISTKSNDVSFDFDKWIIYSGERVFELTYYDKDKQLLKLRNFNTKHEPFRIPLSAIFSGEEATLIHEKLKYSHPHWNV